MRAGREIISLVADRQDLDQFRRKNWEGTFEEYLDLVRTDPRVTRNAFKRVYDMILSYGTETYEEYRERKTRYRFFSDPDDEGRDAVLDLRSSANTTNDLAQALRSVCNELATPDAATFQLTVEGAPRDLHPIIRDELYRITREALRNAFTHACAQHIEAELIYAERLFSLRIRDDGKGIESTTLQEGRAGHYGLPGMRERARQIGAELTIWSGVGTGTEIDLSIPGSTAYRTLPRPRFRAFRKNVK